MEWKSKLEVEAARRLMYQNSTSMDWNPKPLTSKDHGPRQGHSPWQATLPHQAQSGGPQAAFNLFKGAAICMLQSNAPDCFVKPLPLQSSFLAGTCNERKSCAWGGPDVTWRTRRQ